MKRQSIFAVALLLVSMGAGGCEWDSTMYDDFVTQEGENFNVTKCPENGSGGLSYIEYVNTSGQMEKCYYNNCRTSDNCCNISDSIIRRQYATGFSYGLCPANYRCDIDYDEQNNNNIVNYCTSIAEFKCAEGFTRCGNGCYDLTTEKSHCGSCETICKIEEFDNALEVGCKADNNDIGKCVATKCDKGYHEVNGFCQSDDATNCNGINCTNLAGCEQEKGAACTCNKEDNHCISEKCEIGYHKKNDNGVPCVADTDIECGEKRIDCNDQQYWNEQDRKMVEQKICVSGQCSISKCAKNHHPNEEGNKCEPDSITACGSFNNNCKVMAGWPSNCSDRECICENGQCHAKRCDLGYHPYNNIVDGYYRPCEIDTILNCGQKGKACSIEDFDGAGSVVCSQGDCSISICAIGYHWSNGICKKDDESECGHEKYNCSDLMSGFKTGSCLIPYQCTADECMKGYHIFEGKCELDANDHCGPNREKCTENSYCKIETDNEADVRCEQISNCDKQQCDGNCVDWFSNIHYCGDCNTDCSSVYQNAVVSCDGTCKFIKCSTGFHSNKNVQELCEPDTVDACGQYRTNCRNNQPKNTDARCEFGTCIYDCKDGYYDCDGQSYNGCEINLEDNGLKNCNECGTFEIDSNMYNILLKADDSSTDADWLYTNKCSLNSSGKYDCPYIDCGVKWIGGSSIPLCIKKGYSWKNFVGYCDNKYTDCSKCSPKQYCVQYQSGYSWIIRTCSNNYEH